MHSPRVQLGSMAMMLLRASVGFLFFVIGLLGAGHGQRHGLVRRACIAAAAAGAMAGNAVAPRLRGRLSEERCCLRLARARRRGGAGRRRHRRRRPRSSRSRSCVNLAAAIGRLASRHRAARRPACQPGRAFANFETRFQLCWAAPADPGAVHDPGPVGSLVVGIACSGGLVYLLAGRAPRAARRHRGRRDAPLDAVAAAVRRQPASSGSGPRSDPESESRRDADDRAGYPSMRASQSPGASTSAGVGSASGPLEQRAQAVVAGAVDDALHERLAPGHLVLAEADAEQLLDERVARPTSRRAGAGRPRRCAARRRRRGAPRRRRRPSRCSRRRRRRARRVAAAAPAARAT